jgi:cob(I)alamin adenosyltransferase
MKIYTKTGDKGLTSLIGGKKVPKHHYRIEAYGTVDELNSHIGLLITLLSPGNHYGLYLKSVQNILFNMGSLLAAEGDVKITLPPLMEEDVRSLESQIDTMDASLTPLKTFILPGGSAVVAHIHIARCVCRRAERGVTFLNEYEEVDPIIIVYLNRLSDFLFTLARFEAHVSNTPEIPWKPSIQQK